jgi:hypothetical protein
MKNLILKLSPIALFAILFLSCKEEEKGKIKEENLYGYWFTTPLPKLKNDVFGQGNIDYEIQNPETPYLIALFPDGKSMRINADQYFSGKWDYDTLNYKLAIHIKNKGFDFLTKERIEGKKSNYLVVSEQDKNLSFRQVKTMLRNYKEDPFYPQNNLWRIKPKEEENDLQLKQRLFNYVKHCEYILRASLERKEDIISFEYSMGVLQFYRMSIGTTPLYSLENSWIETFYSREQAMKAYSIFDNYLTQINCKTNKTLSWVRDDLRVLERLIAVMQKDLN